LQTLTFYSYKGGVGRTLMVANMARYLASFGKKVFAVDFDLEAPGLHYKLGVESPDRGLVDYLLQLFLVGEVPESLEPYVIAIEPANAAGGSIHLLPAGAAPSPSYWHQLAKLDWHALFYSEEAPGVPLFLELQERIAREHAPDFLLIDSRTGITEVGGATTTLLADRVICLLLNNRENLDGAREVMRSLRRAHRLPGQAQLEIWPVLSRIPEVGGELEAELIREVRDFLCAEAEDLASTLTFPELFVLHADPGLQLREAISIGGGKAPEESPLLRDYLALFGKLVPVEALVGPTVRAIAEQWETDRAGAEKDFAKLAELAPKLVLEPLLAAEITRLEKEKARRVAKWFQERAAANAEGARSLLRVLGLPEPSMELVQATTEYLEYMVDRYRYVDLHGMGVPDRSLLRLPLLEVYVPVKARQEILVGEAWAGSVSSEPVSVLDLLRDQGGLILLGDPGAGKTTFLKYLALALATGQGEALGLGTRLPVPLPLPAYANALAQHDISLEDFLPLYHADQGLSRPMENLLARAFARGRVVLLLDGLDEIRAQEQRSEVVKQVMAHHLRHWPAGNKLVLTSRIVGYRETRPEAAGLAEATLVDFTQEDIESFVGKWTMALETAVTGESASALLAAAQEREELLAAIQANPGVRSLAANPLLLIILVLMKRQGVVLPARRVELYKTCVDTLLRHWNRARGLLAGRPAKDLDVLETTRILESLALWIHQSSPGSGLVTAVDLHRRLEQIYREERGHPEPDEAAQAFLRNVRELAGLLVERGPGRYGFIHLSFQEYLAAAALAQRAPTEVGELTRFLKEHVGEPAWREVILLTVGYLGLIQRWEHGASEVLESLLQVDDPPGLAVVLAGQALADVGVGGVTTSCRTHTVEALVSTILGEHVPAPVRAEAGQILTRLGVRFASDLWV
jgi:hypothetical protein